MYCIYTPRAIVCSLQGVVYIQITRWSKSLCVITEAQDNLRKFWILQKSSEILISLTGNLYNLCVFLLIFFHVPFNLELISTNVTGIT